MNIRDLKTELDRAIYFLRPAPMGFTGRRENVETKISRVKNEIVYTIKIK